MTQPLITVIIPAYNCEKYITNAVESVMHQTTKSLEIIIINDCSTDGTLVLAKRLAERDSRIVVLSNEHNRGVAETRNRGIDLAKGTHVAFLDGDDIWLPDKLEKQLAHMKETGCDLCYTAYSFIDVDGRAEGSVYVVPTAANIQLMLRENVVGLSTALISRQAIGETRFRGNYAHEDYVMWLELMRNGCTAAGINEPLVKYRRLKSSRSGDKKKAAANRWRIYRDFLKMPVIKSAYYFMVYAFRAVKKHYK